MDTKIYKDNSGLYAFRVEDKEAKIIETGVRATRKLAQEAINQIIKKGAQK